MLKKTLPIILIVTAAVLATPAVVLETYSDERRLVAEHTLAQALARLSAWFKDPSKQLPPPVPIVDDWAVYFGHLYSTGTLLPEGGETDKAFGEPQFQIPASITPTGDVT